MAPPSANCFPQSERLIEYYAYLDKKSVALHWQANYHAEAGVLAGDPPAGTPESFKDRSKPWLRCTSGKVA